MSSKLLYVLSSCVLLALLSCGWLTGPDDEVDPRAFTWTVDTLMYLESDQTNMYQLWGSSPSDVYAVGHCSSTRGTMYHFDGTSWSTTGFHVLDGGTITGALELYDILGFSAHDVWFVGEHKLWEWEPPYDLSRHTVSFQYDGET